MNAKERLLGAGAGAIASTAIALIFDVLNNPQNINNQPILWSQLLLYSAIAAGGALMGGVIAAGEGRVRVNRSLQRTGPLR